MDNVWSTNIYVNIVVNTLLFLVGTHFLGFGQFILPIICLILLLDRKFNFKVANIKTFIVLCLFAISFFVFSYKQGFLSLMGFCFPAAYYVGSNIKEPNEENIKKIVYVLTFGMVTHVVLNFFYNIYLKGFHMFFSSSHYDFWTFNKISDSTIAVYYIFFSSLIYYILKYEKNKKIRYFSYIVCLILSIYLVALAERKVILITLISLSITFVIDTLVYNNKVNIKKIIKYILFIVIALALIVFFFIWYRRNFYFNQYTKMRLFEKLFQKGLKSERIDILIKFIKSMPYHIFGNKEISEVMGIMPHDLWLDVYDWGGAITMILLLIYTFIIVYNIVTIVKNKRITNEFKIIVIPLFISVAMQLLLEPMMTGGTLFLICVIIIAATIEKANKYVE